LTWTFLLTFLRFLTLSLTVNTFLRYSGAKLFINLKYKNYHVLNCGGQINKACIPARSDRQLKSRRLMSQLKNMWPPDLWLSSIKYILALLMFVNSTFILFNRYSIHKVYISPNWKPLIHIEVHGSCKSLKSLNWKKIPGLESPWKSVEVLETESPEINFLNLQRW
jgi:hypothetical protein